MNVSFDKSFHKRLVKITDKSILTKVKDVILVVEAAVEPADIPNLKKMEGFKAFYRIRIGDYRIGIEIQKDTVLLITIANRKDIYKRFP